MKKSSVLEYFNDLDNPVSKVAEVCGVSVAAVSQWGEVIPEKNALKLHRHTKGKLKYEEHYYDKSAA